MPTLSTRVSDGELKAITEYANACGMSVSDLIKKILINKICYLWLGNSEDSYFAEVYSAEPEAELETDEENVRLKQNAVNVVLNEIAWQFRNKTMYRGKKREWQTMIMLKTRELVKLF